MKKNIFLIVGGLAVAAIGVTVYGFYKSIRDLDKIDVSDDCKPYNPWQALTEDEK